VRCDLCGCPISPGDLSVATASGRHAHIACADRAAAAAWRFRQRRAMLSALALLAACSVPLWWTGALGLLALPLALATHIALNRRFWHYARRDLLRRLRR
jgi:hypothetical protein